MIRIQFLPWLNGTLCVVRKPGRLDLSLGFRLAKVTTDPSLSLCWSKSLAFHHVLESVAVLHCEFLPGIGGCTWLCFLSFFKSLVFTTLWLACMSSLQRWGGSGSRLGRMFLDIVNPSRMEPAQIINTPFESCVWRRTTRLVARLDVLNHRQRSMDALQRTDVWVRLLLGADSGG